MERNKKGRDREKRNRERDDQEKWEREVRKIKGGGKKKDLLKKDLLKKVNDQGKIKKEKTWIEEKQKMWRSYRNGEKVKESELNREKL